MSISLFDLFSVGVGPSSSHTVGPMSAAGEFVRDLPESCSRVVAEVYGSLALTGIGHGTDRAVLMGLEGEVPDRVNPDTIVERVKKIDRDKKLKLAGKRTIAFDIDSDLLFHPNVVLPCHTNGMQLAAYNDLNQPIKAEVYYSIGGGFYVTEANYGKDLSTVELPCPFDTAEELLGQCKKNKKSIAQVMMANEEVWHSKREIKSKLKKIARTMTECIEKGCETTGTLPGGLNVRRRAPDLYQKLLNRGIPSTAEERDVMNWLNLYAIAVNEVNASGGRIVTAPTNGASGIIPAVMSYYRNFCEGADEEGVIEYLLTAGAIAILYKKNASISGAEVGCQGEVGVASSMAAAGLTAVLGGTVAQVENAAEIAMEHHLGMTCDPIAGLVQVPCIERNAMGAVKAVNAGRLSLMEDSRNLISLDKVIKTMFQTGKDMMTIYKETSQGGLAVNVVEC